MERPRSSQPTRRGRRERGNGSISSADERAVQSDSGMTFIKRERKMKRQGGDFGDGLGHHDDGGGGDIVSSGRGMRRVNLSRDYLVRCASGKVQNGG